LEQISCDLELKNKDTNSAEGSQNSMQFEIIIISQNLNVFSCFRDATDPY